MMFDLLGLAALVGAILGAVAVGQVAGGVVFILAVVVAVVALNRLRLVASEGTLLSCSGFRTRRWNIDEIEGFVLSRQPLGGGWVEVVLHDCTAWPLSATLVALGRQEAEAALARLNGWVKSDGT